MENINNSYFDGYYKDMWKTLIPEKLTDKEVDFMVDYFKLQTGDKVLDMMCGYGRHSIQLAKKGMLVTAVDNLKDYIDEIDSVSKIENLSIQTVKSDIIDYKSTDIFDLAICMGNSLNFFSAEETVNIFSTVASNLKKGGHLLINTWSLMEIVAKNFIEKSWTTINNLKYLIDSKLFFHPTRIETESVVMDNEGIKEIKRGIDYIFSIAEMESMLEQTNFKIKEIYSIPGKKNFSIGDPRAYIVAVKK